jgi:hypothetical protein
MTLRNAWPHLLVVLVIFVGLFPGSFYCDARSYQFAADEVYLPDTAIMSRIVEMIVFANNPFADNSALTLQVQLDEGLSALFPLKITCNATFFYLSELRYFFDSPPSLELFESQSLSLFDQVPFEADSVIAACRFRGNLESVTLVSASFNPGTARHSIFRTITHFIICLTFLLFLVSSIPTLVFVRRVDGMIYLIHEMVLLGSIRMEMTDEMKKMVSDIGWNRYYGIFQSLAIAGIRCSWIIMALWVRGSFPNWLHLISQIIFFVGYGILLYVMNYWFDDLNGKGQAICQKMVFAGHLIAVTWAGFAWLQLLLEDVKEVTKLFKNLVLVAIVISWAAFWITGDETADIFARRPALKFFCTDLVDVFIIGAFISFLFRKRQG